MTGQGKLQKCVKRKGQRGDAKREFRQLGTTKENSSPRTRSQTSKGVQISKTGHLYLLQSPVELKNLFSDRDDSLNVVVMVS